jgi:DNA-directed RNA polymerase specialized sigma24 family protein
MDLESVYTNRRHDILRLLIRSGVNFTEAEDVTQQVFVNAYERPATVPREGSLFS